MERVLKFVCVVGIAGVLLVQIQAAAGASTPHAYLTPQSTAISATQTLPQTQIALYTNGEPGALVSCTGFSFGFTTPIDNTLVNLRHLTFSGCTVSVHGTEGVATVTASGQWRIHWTSQTKALLINGANTLTITSSDCTTTVSPQKIYGEEKLTMENQSTVGETLTFDGATGDFKHPWPATDTGACTYNQAFLFAEETLTPAITYNPAPTS